jgi:hypothetical protein
MNEKQVRVLQTITKQKWIEWKTGTWIEGSLTFSVTDIGDKVFVHASNTDTIEWFQKQAIIQMVVGPRGGINSIKSY